MAIARLVTISDFPGWATHIDPVDMTPGAALSLQNTDFGRRGSLRSRAGLTRTLTGSDLGTAARSMRFFDAAVQGGLMIGLDGTVVFCTDITP